VDATSFLVIDLSDWAILAGPTFLEGSLQLFYRGADLQLGAQVKLIDRSLSLMFDEQLVEPAAMFKSSQLEGVWWLPTKHCQVNLVLSNTTDVPVSVFVAVEGIAPEEHSPAELLLQAHETRVTDLGKTYREEQARPLPKVGAISIRHSGPKGALLARGIIQESLIGYSSAIQFGDPLNAKSSRLHGAGLRLGEAACEQLTTIVVARNIGDTKTVLSGRIPFTSVAGNAGEYAIDKVKLQAGETRALKLSVNRHRVKRDEIVSAGLEFEHDSKPGSIVMSALSTSATRNQVFQLPMLDPLAQRSSTGGYPWFIEGDSSTVVYIKNTSERPQQYAGHLNWTDGQYVLGLTTIESGQTVALDIGALRNNQVGDEQGRTIPLDLARGQIRWSLVRGEVPGDLVLIGRAEQVDLARGMSSSYACQSCCNDGFYSADVSPYSAEVEINGTVDFDAYQTDVDCYGNLVTYNRSFGVSWSTSNSQIATVNSSGTATASGPGTVTITASWTTVYNEEPPFPCGGPYSPEQPDLPDPCACDSSPRYAHPAASLVVRPKISGPVTLWWFNNYSPSGYVTQITLTAMPANAGSYQWAVVAGTSFVNFSNNSDNITTTTNQVVVKSTGQSADQLDIRIRVTVNNVSSFEFRLTSKAPNILTFVRADHMTDGATAYSTLIHYQIKDQFGVVLPSNVPFSDFFTTPEESLHPGENWERGQPNGVPVNPADVVDHLSPGAGLGLVPAPRPPCIPLCNVPVVRWDGSFHVGTTNVGQGLRVQTHTWQLYTDHGEHRNRVSPAPL
jgi:hypothetical protein